ncbi:MAG: hypothetical protein NTY53_18900 [Kiritimatiellaeota bacterium]|nr:hypothetical protein [Kiritimatiellota bacterium]
MDKRIERLKTSEECDQVVINATKRGELELAQAAYRRGVELLAAKYGAKYGVTNEVEIETLQALCAYEKVLEEKHGKRVRAARTWQMIKTHGILGAIERAVNRQDDASGYKALVEMGMTDLAFEAVVCRHPDMFKAETVKRAQERLKVWGSEAKAI